MDFSETIEVKVADKDDNLAIDSYFFAYFHNLSGALDQIREAVRTHRSRGQLSPRNAPLVLDTTIAPRSPASERVVGVATPETKPTSGFRISSLFRPFSDTGTIRSGSASTDLQNEEYTHVSRKADSTSFIPVTTSPRPLLSNMRHIDDSQESTTAHSLPPADHTYPPSTSNSAILPNHSSLSRDSSSSWSVGVPSWLKSSRRVFGGSPAPMEDPTFTNAPVKEVYSTSGTPYSRSSGVGDMAFSVLESPNMLPDQEIAEKFRTAFAYDEKETLLGCRFKSKQQQA